MSATKQLEPNIHLLSLYPTDQSMFELDGRHFKSAFGKDYLDSLLTQADSGMVKVSLDADICLSESDNRLTVVEGRVDLVRQDLVDVAWAAEEANAALNQRFVIVF